jgi:hypothetical protein
MTQIRYIVTSEWRRLGAAEWHAQWLAGRALHEAWQTASADCLLWLTWALRVPATVVSEMTAHLRHTTWPYLSPEVRAVVEYPLDLADRWARGETVRVEELHRGADVATAIGLPAAAAGVRLIDTYTHAGRLSDVAATYRRADLAALAADLVRAVIPLAAVEVAITRALETP